MPRRALRTFFERLLVASLPLSAVACGGGDHAADPGALDMAVKVPPIVDMAVYDPPVTVYPPDPCEAFPIVDVVVPSEYNPDGGLVQECRADHVCSDLCPTGYTICCGPNPGDADGGTEGKLTMACSYFCPTGRRPAGMQAEPATGAGPLGAYFAGMAQLEAASVHAFAGLTRELQAHGAPRSLVAAARRARADEVRHARVTARLARRHGCAPARVTVAPHALRSLCELATENAAEGCVRETFGALLASWQARAALDGEVRAAMLGIAEDETRHAELAWAIDAWAMRRLDAAARRRVRAARRAAAATLADEIGEPPTELARAAGMPSAAQARRLVRDVTAALWT